MNKYSFAWITAVAMAMAMAWAAPAQAYMGPGAGLSAIGSFLSLLATVFFALVGLVWYPVRRLLRKRPTQIK